MPEKQINLSVDDGDAFFAHEVSINFNPTQFILDFKNVTPRVDPRCRDGALLKIKHNVVMIDLYHLKKMHTFIAQRIKDYEKEFGKIEEPKAVQHIRKKRGKDSKAKKQKKIESAPSYLG